MVISYTERFNFSRYSDNFKTLILSSINSAYFLCTAIYAPHKLNSDIVFLSYQVNLNTVIQKYKLLCTLFICCGCTNSVSS